MILRNHDLKWRGDFNAHIFKWSNPDSKLIADFEKNEVTGQTINSFILIESDDQGFFDEMRKFLIEAGGEVYSLKENTPEDAFKVKMAEWIKENEPNIKVLREVHHAPDSFINYRLKEFEQKKVLYERELKGVQL